MRRVRRKAGNKEKVFGCDLLEHLNASSQEIPQVLRCCSEFVETHGVVDGIYRLSGVSSNIQKLRGEFESDGSPDLNKDVYLQDIHCVSSLCKAYFRELPNPLLTYQLYDKFAEAVAIQLEEERLVKIRDVLKELPRPHYRTLEFLMRHLVHMASFSSETNMHARNLAIVWAPNLLRSKDIEASGFNGRAAFMEVRVQSIVVEFILTHVPQLFPVQGVTSERRKSLPFPTAASSQEEGVLKTASIQPPPNFGNISPGDGPLPIRPYHAIIEGTDKRKGSLKGRKWMSIFNIGGRFHDPRRRQKHSAKEKERPVLRPARSMDSLSPSYPNEGCRRTNQRPPSTNMSAASPLVTHSPKPGSDAPAATGALGASEYAVTYRRGTGLVSGGAGTQGTYTALDPEGLGGAGNETVQTRSPGLSTKVGRRAAMHITGPTLVTVPLHITSNLAYGVLQGGGGDRIVHRGRDKDGGDRAEVREGGERVERKVEWGKPVEEEDKSNKGKVAEAEAVVDGGEKTAAAGGGEEEEEEGGKGKKEEAEEVREECRWEEQLVMGGADVTREKRAKNSTCNTEEDDAEDAVVDDQQVEENDEYEDMKPADFQVESTHQVYDASDILNSTEVEGDDLGLSGYVQDNFEFLDQMEFSVMDHMDCSVSNQVKEFSVEPPGHSDDEYELMEQASHRPTELHLQPEGHEAKVHSPTEPNLHRPLSIDTQSRHTKSLSLPYMTSPVHGPEGSSSEELAGGDDSDVNDYSSDDGDDSDDSFFMKSLPADFILGGFESVADTQDSNALDGVPVDQLQISEEKENLEVATCIETTAGDQKQVEVEDEEDTDGLEEKEITEKEDEVQQRGEQWENGLQSKATEEVHRDASEASTHCCADDSLQRNDKSYSLPDITVEEEEKKVVDDLHSDFPACPAVPFVTQEEIADPPSDGSADFSASEEPRSFVRGGDGDEDRKVHKETEDTCPETDVKIKENDENMWEETAEEGDKATEMTDIQQEGDIQEDGAMCEPGDQIWGELEDVICEVIQDEEREQVEKKDVRKSVARDKDGKVEEKEEQIAKVSEEEMLETDGGGTEETELRTDVEEDSTVATKEKVKDAEIQQESEEKETNLPKTTKLDKALQGKKADSDETQHHDREEVIQKDKENNYKERAFGKQRTLPSADLIRSDMKELKDGRKCEESESSPGGVGRKLVVSKHPKVYQVKAVPVVPPKPQHCKITALTLRQQQQERERREADRGRENLPKVPTELERGGGGERQGTEEERGKKEKLTPRGGEKERERRRDGDENAMREKGRNSPLSMCFDEAVAIATMRREKEKECEKEKEKEKE